jgi:hypothetical protein
VLDRLLGRAELRERIASLEAERDSLEEQLAAESDRRADAVSAKQAAEERCNRLEDRIADLEGQLSAADDAPGGAAAPTVRRTETRSGAGLRRIVERLQSIEAPPEGFLTATVGPDPDPEALDPIRSVLGDRAELVRRVAPAVVYVDDAELCSVAISPPLPPEPFAEWGAVARFDDAWCFQAAQGHHAVALVRSDLFALGVFDGAERVEFEGFDSDVMGSHSKGGYSQGRFERRREAAVEEHLDRCREVIGERVDCPLVLTGDEHVIDRLDVEARRRLPVDATGKPEAALDDAVRSLWTSTVYAI